MADVPDQTPAGELIVRNGKRPGARLPLRHPATLIGSANGCDVRLTADGIGPVHCVIAITPEGPTLRAGFHGETLVNGLARRDGVLADGDEVRVGPCVFRVAWAPVAPTPPAETLPAEAAQLADHLDDRQRQLAEREQQLADARAAFRRERDAGRDRIEADRAEADRLRREAAALNREAARDRDRARRLAYRFVRRERQKWAGVRAELEAREAAIAEARGRLTAEVARFEIARSESCAAAAADRQRLDEEWAALEGGRRRAAAEWAEASDYFAMQQAALDARAAELAGREKALADDRKTLERETAGLRQEAAGLDARIQNARAVVEELERQRDRLRAELLGPVVAPAPEPAPVQVALDRAADRDLTAWAAELDAKELELNRRLDGLGAVQAGLDRDASDLADRRRVLAEQFVMLAAARSQWQEAERRTVGEMEELARGLRRREQDLDAREERLIRTDARRREDAYELWKLRLRLEAWQSKLVGFEARCRTVLSETEAALARRVQALARREAEVEETFGRWERARAEERERLRAELQLWADDRARLARAAEEYDRRAREVLGELVAHAARALASEEFVAGAVPDAGSGRVARRLRVLRKRWEQAFRRRVEEADERRAAAAAELTRSEERYRELHRFLTELADREEAVNNREARAAFAELMAGGRGTTVPEDGPAARTEPTELVLLRGEVDRMVAVLLDAGLPEVPDSELPWAAEEAATEPDDVLPFHPPSRAA